MTPHQADIAFVLERVSGVLAVYAIDPSRRVAAHLDFAIRLEFGWRILAEVHYALLRVLTHEECARVHLFYWELPSFLADGARPLVLAESEREEARSRIAPPLAREAIAPPQPRHQGVLIVDDYAAVGEVVRKALEEPVVEGESPTSWLVVPEVGRAVNFARDRKFSIILCDASRAFGDHGLLARLPLDVARRVLILAAASELAEARLRLQSTDRIVVKPLETWVLRERIVRAYTMNMPALPDAARVTSPEPPPRRALASPPTSAPFSALLVDLDDEIHHALRRIFREDARHVMRRDPEQAAEVALSAPFHLIACSANAALRPRSILDALALEDHAGADRVIVLAPARDVPYVKHNIEVMGRRNTVLALPVDDTSLRREVFRDQPALAARLAVAEIAGADPARVARPKFRRLGVLVVDDDPTTEIMFAAGEPLRCAEVTLASTPMQAFEHVTSRAVNLLVISATMRGDGGEPFYRVLWRLKPELKSRCVLVTPAELSPRAVPMRTPPRCVERPLTHHSINRIVEAFARR